MRLRLSPLLARSPDERTEAGEERKLREIEEIESIGVIADSPYR